MPADHTTMSIQAGKRQTTIFTSFLSDRKACLINITLYEAVSTSIPLTISAFETPLAQSNGVSKVLFLDGRVEAIPKPSQRTPIVGITYLRMIQGFKSGV